jgi:virulence-associated protein VapD
MWTALNDPLVKRFIFLPGLVLFIGATLLSSTITLQSQWLEQDEIAYQSATQEATRLLQKVRFLRNQEALYLQYGDQYAAVLQKGLVKDFDRVAWVDGLIRVTEALQISGLKILIEPEQLIKKSDLKSQLIKKDIFYYTRINLAFGLQTDVDLLKMMDLISQEISAHFFVEKCKLEMPYDLGKQLDFNPLNGNILGECSLIVFQAKPSELKTGN